MRLVTPLIGGAAASVLASCAPAAAAESIRSHFVGFSGGLLMSIIAFSIVFIVVCGLMIMMMLLKAFVGTIDGAKKPAPAPAKPAAPAAPAAAPAPAAIAPPACDDECETIAAITAAIAVMIDGPAHITSITPAEPVSGHHRPYAGATPWRMAGILGNTSGLGD